MSKNQLRACALTALFAASPDTALGQHSLKDLARANGSKATVSSDVLLPAADLEKLVEGADVIAQGHIVKVETALNQDETMVWTYVTLSPAARLFKDTLGGKVMRQPGAPPAVTFKDVGGTVKMDGLEMTFRSNISADPVLQVGEEVLVFLAKGEDGDLFVQYGSYGLLRVRGKHVASANRETARQNRLGSEDVSNVLGRLQVLVAKSPGR